MKKIALLFISICTIFFAGCENELDNYDGPNAGIKGRILDAQTNEPIPLPVQGPTGVIINLFEQDTNASKSVDFYAKMDGSYEHSQIFSCNYKVVVKGPFVGACEEIVNVKGQTTHDFKATPYARITAEATVNGKVVTIKYKVTPSYNNFNISEVYGFWNFAPGVDNGSSNNAGKITKTETEGTMVFDLTTNSNYTSNIHKISSNNNKIYVRIGAKTEGVVNYSKIVEVIVK